MEKIKLSSNCTVEQYLQYKLDKNKEEIIQVFLDRFIERYVKPFKGNPHKHGFSMMAITCLMIENLYCFQKGYAKTPHAKGNEFFNDFFENSINLKSFAKIKFYKKIRCGLLHQGETYGGWKIKRKGSLIDLENLEINANLFMKEVLNEIKFYAQKTKESDFESGEWSNLIKKFDNIVKNCEKQND